MNYSVTAASGYAIRLVGSHNHGAVHSVYRKAINLSLDGQLVALQAAGSPLSPISLILPLSEGEIAALPVAVGDPISASPGMLQIGQLCAFSFAHVRPQDLALASALPKEQLAILEERILQALSSQDAGSFELLLSNPERAGQIPFLAIAKERLCHSSQALSLSEWEEGAQSLCRLMGLGLGLTPGGDDFLCGVLAGLILCDSQAHPFARILEEEIAEHLSDTNDISAAFLRCALDGQFSQAVHSLRSLPTQAQILSVFSEIGHSSGTDTLCGIAYILHHRHRITA